jgi:hypothetical protein
MMSFDIWVAATVRATRRAAENTDIIVDDHRVRARTFDARRGMWSAAYRMTPSTSQNRASVS